MLGGLHIQIEQNAVVYFGWLRVRQSAREYALRMCNYVNHSNRRVLLLAIFVLVLLAFAHTVGATVIVPPNFTVEQVNTGAFTLVQPKGLVVDANATIYVGNNFFSGSSNLLRIPTSGKVTAIASFSSFIGGLALESNGTLIGSLASSPKLSRPPEQLFKIQRGNVSIFGSSLPFGAAEGVVVGTNNDLFVANFNDKSVSKVTSDGNASTFVRMLGGPFGVTFKGESLFIGDNLGNGDGPGRVLEVDASGNIVRSTRPIPGRVIALQYDPFSDSFFVANEGEPSGTDGAGIDRLLDGQVIPFATGFDEYPRDVALGPTGSLYVVDASSLYIVTPYIVTPVPEPNSIVLLGTSALVFIVGYGRSVCCRNCRKRTNDRLSSRFAAKWRYRILGC